MARSTTADDGESAWMRMSLVYLGRRGAGGPLCLELAVHLGAHANVTAFVSPRSETAPRWRSSGVDLAEVETFGGRREALSALVDHRSIRRIADRIRQSNPDVVLFPYFHVWNPWIQARLEGIPSVVTLHDPTPHPGLTDRLFELLQRLSARRASRLIVLSEVFVQDAIRMGLAKEKVAVVPLGALDYYRRIGVGSPPERHRVPRLLFFGRIESYKGLSFLIEAFRDLRRRHPLKLRIAGEGDLGHYRQELESDPDVEVFLGWIPEEEVGAHFEAASMVTLPYASATQSGVISIAAAYARPVVATSVGGIPEQVKQGETGLLVPPGSAQALAEAIERLLADPAAATRMGDALKRDFDARFCWPRLARMTYAVCVATLESSTHRDRA